jgi:hypothetical protein
MRALSFCLYIFCAISFLIANPNAATPPTQYLKIKLTKAGKLLF